MKSFHQYLIENIQTFEYTIKIAGEVEKKNLDLFLHNLQKFDPVKIAPPTSTPVQQDPYGFPGMKNVSVQIIKAEFKYPATDPQIKQLARLSGIPENNIVVVTTAFNDSVNHEDKGYSEEDAQKASKDYANQYLDSALPKEPSLKLDFAGEKTPTAKNTSKEGINTRSPMTNVTRPPLPKTGWKP